VDVGLGRTAHEEHKLGLVAQGGNGAAGSCRKHAAKEEQAVKARAGGH
jgi:hypothetical protein